MIRPIRLFGDPVLRTPAEPVTDFDLELRNLVRDLTETMVDAPGVGLAAPQIGVSLRVFTYHVGEEPGHLINPVLGLDGEQEEDDEACLSLPGLVFPTLRAPRVVATGFNMYGDPVTIEGSELLARCVQHETDHLDGILFIDRLDKRQRKLAMKAIREAEWNGEPAPEVKVSPHATQRIS
ncbi:MAG: peptide deformylase [Trebonia sp.]